MAALGRLHRASKLVDDAGETITSIVAAVERVTAFMSNISMASREQSIGIGQVNQAVAQMEKMTEQNARLVEQAEVASNRIQDQAGKLAQLVSSFKLSAIEQGTAIRAGNVAGARPMSPALLLEKKSRSLRKSGYINLNP